MNITHNYNPATSVWEVSLSGEVDVYNAPQLKEELYRLLDQHNSSIVIDCRDLKYIDSTGLGVLIGVLKRVKDNNGSISLKNLKPYIKKIFTITGLDKIFLIEVQE
ncbi:anti-sigma B factor antagonist [Caldicoprobacter guelmensis]|uniref:STAS domain-containing protein n=1 Tax=Caldicoprobacter guelmensis TaxID=1170224 RepID=UPI00195951CC|nr:STAS domain-containing protein [Caldicoprobacter guelmensis]MBM7581970.1 anti-sigma B factor antagonist [Caldicoprobacter guelmensis]